MFSDGISCVYTKERKKGMNDENFHQSAICTAQNPHSMPKSPNFEVVEHNSTAFTFKTHIQQK